MTQKSRCLFGIIVNPAAILTRCVWTVGLFESACINCLFHPQHISLCFFPDWPSAFLNIVYEYTSTLRGWSGRSWSKLVETRQTQHETKKQLPTECLYFTCGQLQPLTSRRNPRKWNAFLMGWVRASGAPDIWRRWPEKDSWGVFLKPTLPSAAQKTRQKSSNISFHEWEPFAMPDQRERSVMWPTSELRLVRDKEKEGHVIGMKICKTKVNTAKIGCRHGADKGRRSVPVESLHSFTTKNYYVPKNDALTWNKY